MNNRNFNNVLSLASLVTVNVAVVLVVVSTASLGK